MTCNYSGNEFFPAFATPLQGASNLFELFPWESSHCLGTNASLCNRAQYEACSSLIIRSICDHNVVILSQHQVETDKFASNFFCCIVERSQAFGGVFEVFDPLLTQ